MDHSFTAFLIDLMQLAVSLVINHIATDPTITIPMISNIIFCLLSDNHLLIGFSIKEDVNLAQKKKRKERRATAPLRSDYNSMYVPSTRSTLI